MQNKQIEKSSGEVTYVPFGQSAALTITLDHVARFVATPSKSGATPDKRTCVRFLMECKAKALDPYAGDAYLIGYDSKDGTQWATITAHQALLKRAEACKEHDGIESGVIVQDPNGEIQEIPGKFVLPDQKLLGGWSTVFLKDRGHHRMTRLNLEVFNNGQGRWKIDPAGQIVKCAEADALRSAYPSTIGGLYIGEEMMPHAVDVTADVETGQDRAGRASKLLSRAPSAEQDVEDSGAEPDGEAQDEAANSHRENLLADLAIAEADDPEVVTAALKSMGMDRYATPKDLNTKALEKLAKTVAKLQAPAAVAADK